MLFFESGWFLLTRAKPMILRLFGARIGDGIVIKPHVRIKYPWLLEVGNFCWIGQQTWIDNLAPVYLGDDVCVSQGAYFCTGSHNYRSRRFDLVTREIVVEKGAWVGAKAIVLGGVTIGRNAILAAGSVAQHEIPAGKVAVGNPATPVRDRPPIENL